MIRPSFVALAFVVIGIVACSGGGVGRGMLPTAQSYDTSYEAPMWNAAPNNSKIGTVVFNLVVPAHPVTKHHPADLSPATQGVNITVTAAGVKPATRFFPLTRKQKYCKGGTPSTSLNCQLVFNVPASNDTFALSTYSATSKKGPILGQGRIVQKVAPNKEVTIGITMYGIVAFLQIAPENPFPVAGRVAQIPIDVTAADAWGYIIVGDYETPITLTDSDKSGNTKLSTTLLASSGDADALKIAYKGKPMKPATITATSDSVSDATTLSPGAKGIVTDPAVLRVAFGTVGTTVIVGGPGSIGPYAVSTKADAAGDPSCAGIVTVSGSGKRFVVKPKGNLGVCWLAVSDGAKHTAGIPVLLSAFAYATSQPSTPPSETPSPSPTPSPTPTPPLGPVAVTPNLLTLCPSTGPNKCTPFTATVAISQPNTPGTFIESDNCNSSFVVLKLIDPVGPVIHYKITAQGNTGKCTASFTGLGGRRGVLGITVQASGIIINEKPQVHHLKQKEQ